MHTIFKSKLINLFPKKEEVVAAPSFNTDFDGGECKCVQQNLDLSDLTQADSKVYEKSKQKLSEFSREAMRSILKARDQRDLFELF